MKIFDTNDRELGIIQQKILIFLPKFEIYLENRYIDYFEWNIEGNFMKWDYCIFNRSGQTIATISKQLRNLTDTYKLDIVQQADALGVLMLVLAIDAKKCSRK